jgi:hypothetical protein
MPIMSFAVGKARSGGGDGLINAITIFFEY